MKNTNVKKLVLTAILSAMATILMFVDFPVFFMPSFIKLDVSELPALIAAFVAGPIWGGAVCLIKNLINLTRTSTGGVGELCNFLMGITFVIPAGLIYKFKKTRGGAIAGAFTGAVCMAILSLPINYFITYPMYSAFLPIEAIVGMYQAIFPGVDGLFSCLLIFNVPFTFLKGVLCSVFTIIVYKPVSKILKL